MSDDLEPAGELVGPEAELRRRLHTIAVHVHPSTPPGLSTNRFAAPARRSERPRVLVAAAVALVALLGLGAVLWSGTDEAQEVVTVDETTTPTLGTTTEPPRTSTSTEPSTTTTTAATTTTEADGGRPLDGQTPLSARGLGPIQAGMTVAAAEQASGLELVVELSSPDDDNGCFLVSAPGHPDVAIRAVRQPGSDTAPDDAVIVHLWLSSGSDRTASTRQTVDGLRLGSTEAEVRSVYGDRIDEQPHLYTPGGAFLYVEPPDAPGFGFRYVVDERRVVTVIDAGLSGAITAPEGCL